MACRSIEKAEAAAEDIRKKYANEKSTGEIVIIKLDLSSLNSVRCCADHLNRSENRIDLLINNAAVLGCPKTITEDGFEMHFETNHLGHFLLTLLLLPKMIKSAPARVINVSSITHLGNTFINTCNSICKNILSLLDSRLQLQLDTIHV